MLLFWTVSRLVSSHKTINVTITLDGKLDDGKTNDENSNNEKAQDVDERRCSSSDPVNLSLGYRERDEDSNDGHIDVETIGNAPSKVSFSEKRNMS